MHLHVKSGEAFGERGNFPQLAGHDFQHGLSIHALVDQAVATFDLYDVADHIRCADPAGMDSTSDALFIFNILDRKPIMEEFEDLPIFPFEDIGSPTAGERGVEGDLVHDIAVSFSGMLIPPSIVFICYAILTEQ